MTDKPFRILALNGSPRGRKSNTDILLKAFLEGAATQGASSETLYATDLEIRDCLGCFACWTKTPGVCVHKDDMPRVLEKILASDLTIWATPLYHYGMTARLKRILERTLPLAKPWFVRKGDHYTHPPRYPEHTTRNFLLSNCGFPERHHFDALVREFELLANGDDERFLGSLLCTTGELLHVPEMRETLSWYFDAVRTAGAEIVTSLGLSPETAEILRRPLIPVESFVLMGNAHWNVPGETPPSAEEALGPDRTRS
jgi:hypothetical protein